MRRKSGPDQPPAEQVIKDRRERTLAFRLSRRKPDTPLPASLRRRAAQRPSKPYMLGQWLLESRHMRTAAADGDPHRQ
jgi:hypothetical protein